MNRPSRIVGWALALILPLLSCVAVAEVVHHDLRVTLEPAAHRIAVRDRITLHAPAAGPLTFDLHAGLAPETEEGYRLKRVGTGDRPVPFERYAVALPAGAQQFTLRYAGVIHHPPGERIEGVGQVRAATPGTIGPEGVYLGGAAGWYPILATAPPVTFTLETVLPEGWLAVSQGALDELGPARVRWREGNPQDDIHLVAAAFELYRRSTPVGEAQVFLRRPDRALAERYLDATERYLTLYDRLLGDYPYAKFALVENFWETGWGMPSFTLLGSRVIRLPFILDSSYPHEIVHNWWGNGVWVDYEQGNWSEGLTAYLADHLLKEAAGQGAEYRRDGLQKYAEYVREHTETPLTGFVSRHGEASQAIGYGKGMMLFHMLRQRLGDAGFLKGLRTFYRENRFRVAGYGELRRAFEKASGSDLAAFFTQWVERAGAPAIAIERVEAVPRGEGWVLSGTLRQTQPGAVYRLEVPLAVQSEGAEPFFGTLSMETRELPFEVSFADRPVRVAVDPRFDLFRRLDPTELPPSLDRLFAGEGLHMVLPSAAPPALLEGYRALAAVWARGGNVTVVEDSSLERLPPGPVWLLGWENRFRDRVTEPLAAGVVIDSERVVLEGNPVPRAGSSIVLTAGEAGRPLGLLATDNATALSGLARKLPHYGKYSYLAFTGDAPDIAVRGQWRVTASPLVVDLAEPPAAPIELPPRPPLARFAEMD